MTLFMTISWMAMNPDNAWQELRDTASQLAKQLSGMKAGPFIKVLSLGEEKRTPHVHYVVPQAMASSIRRIVKKKWKGQVRVHVEPIKEIGRVLGYIFDRNFIPASLDPARIKRMQLLTASRPMKYGFPVNGKKVKRSPAKELKQAFGKAAANHHGKESDMDGVSF